MKILEKHNYEFKAQLDKLERLYSIKCILLEKNTDPVELYYKIKAEHLKPLFGTIDNELMTGEIENDSVYLSMVFRVEGVFFESAYNINLVTGEVMFFMDRPSIMKEDFVAPKDMDVGLAERIKEIMTPDKLMETLNDERFDKYYSDKFLSTFIDYVGYLEELVSVNKCQDCIYAHQYRLSGFCKELFVKNRCI